MKSQVVCGFVLFVASSILAADAVKEEVTAAAKKLASQSYSWKTTVDTAGGGRFRPGPTEGKTQQDGLTMLEMTRGDNTVQAVIKNGKGAVKTDDGWRSISDAAEDGDGERGRGRFMARMLQNYRLPAADATALLEKSKDLKKSGDAYTGDLTADGVRDFLSFGRRRDGGEGPAVSNPKGTVKFWVKDGVLTKYEYNVQGSMTFNDNDVDIDRTTTVEIKNVGSTEVKVPDEAKSKLSS